MKVLDSSFVSRCGFLESSFCIKNSLTGLRSGLRTGARLSSSLCVRACSCPVGGMVAWGLQNMAPWIPDNSQPTFVPCTDSTWPSHLRLCSYFQLWTKTFQLLHQSKVACKMAKAGRGGPETFLYAFSDQVGVGLLCSSWNVGSRPTWTILK